MGQRKLRISSRKAVEVPVVVLDNLEKDEEVNKKTTRFHKIYTTLFLFYKKKI
jgi:hypothetical protein